MPDLAVSEAEGPVSPELVLVDPALRAHLATRYPVPPEIGESPAAVAASDAPDPSASRATDVPPVRVMRRLLVAGVIAAAVSATVGSAVFAGVLLASRDTAPNRAAAPPIRGAASTPPLPPAAPQTTVVRAADAVTPDVVTPRPAARTRAAAPARKAADSVVVTPPPVTRTEPAAAAPEPAAGGATPSSPWLGWPPVANASSYAVEITRNGEPVYSVTTSVPHLRIPHRWRRDGRTMTLSPGTYHWSVWPLVGRGIAARKVPPTVVASTLEIAP